MRILGSSEEMFIEIKFDSLSLWITFSIINVDSIKTTIQKMYHLFHVTNHNNNQFIQ